MKQIPGRLYLWILFALAVAAFGILVHFEVIILKIGQ